MKVYECIRCPFCLENDFDLLGLKHHLESGYCEIYNELEAPRRMF